jgi:hypothetical protein
MVFLFERGLDAVCESETCAFQQDFCVTKTALLPHGKLT